MSNNILQPSFAAGELSPALWARTDLAKYHVGAARLRNFFVNYSGGASNRAGTQYVGRCLPGINRPISFTFSTLQAYSLIFSDLKMRVVMNGGLVLEPAQNITGITKASTGVLSYSGTDPANGDWMYLSNIGGMTQLNGRTVIVSGVNTGANTFNLHDLDGNAINTSAFTAWSAGGTMARIYTVASPYAASDLALLKFTQSADTMTLTHVSYPPYHLTRSGHAAWTFTEINFQPAQDPPTGISASTTTPFSPNGTVYSYVATAIARNGLTESRASGVASSESSTMSIAPAVHLTIGFTAASGASAYNIYRQMEVPGSAAAAGSLYGFIGSTTEAGEAAFVDNNIAPDFTQTPPMAVNPFAPKPIQSVAVTAQGSGYPDNVTLNVADSTGSGAQLTATVSGGKIMAIGVQNGGQNYTSPTITVNAPSGTGAAATYTVSPVDGTVDSVTVTSGGSGYQSVTPSVTGGAGATLHARLALGVVTNVDIVTGGSGYSSGSVTFTQIAGSGATFSATVSPNTDYPGCCTYFDGRQIFAGSTNSPQTIWTSKSGDFVNMDFSTPARADDAITVTLNASQVNAIQHLVPMQAMLAMTIGGAWKIDGGGQSDAITAIGNFSAKQQVYNGCSTIVPPIVCNNDLLYVQYKGSIVRDLAYNVYANLFIGTDLTALSSHLFFGHTITQWAYAEEPFKIIWAVREDGILLSLTFLKDQEVYGWAHSDTQGLFKGICSVSEPPEDAIYVIVERTIPGVNSGNPVQYIERLHTRNMLLGAVSDVAQAWFVDSGLQYPLVFPNANVTPTGSSGVVTLNADADVFYLTMVGNTVRLNGGLATVTFYNNPASVNVTTIIDFQKNEFEQQITAQAGDWTCTEPVSTLTNLWHLEGATVVALAGGSVTPAQVVENGQITLDHAEDVITVGLPYKGQLQTLYVDIPGGPTVVGKRKKISAINLRVADTRGLKACSGPVFTSMREIKERTTQLMGQPIGLVTGDERIIVDPRWETTGQICIQQDNPLPASVLGLAPEIVVGDN